MTLTNIFADSGVSITSDGRPYPCAAIGSVGYVETYVHDKVKAWCANISLLSEIAMLLSTLP